jgi:hypothetical protein
MTCAVCLETVVARPSAKRKFCSLDCYRRSRKAPRRLLIERGLQRCSRCSEVKSMSEFYASGIPGDTRNRWCKACRCETERLRRMDPVKAAEFRDRYQNDREFRATQVVKSIQKKCRRLQLECDIDADWLAAKFINGTCELTGLAFQWSVRNSRPGPFTPSVDRIEPGQGYTKGNCRVILNALNGWMSDYRLEQFLVIAEALVERQSAVRRAVA